MQRCLVGPGDDVITQYNTAHKLLAVVRESRVGACRSGKGHTPHFTFRRDVMVLEEREEHRHSSSE